MVVPVTHSEGGSGVRSVEDPIPTLTTAKGGEFAVAEPTMEYDILFRMFEAHELAAAMGFNTDDQKYEFAGTKTEQIKQIGNAVSVRKMEACVGAIMSDAAPMATSATAPNEAA
jgi:DNA (cytosine-5)-methyltransferase 1